MATKVYLLHYERPIGNPHHPYGQAQHYLGYTGRKSLKYRLAEHANGKGAKITAAFAKAGIAFQCVRTWDGGRKVERYLKRRHGYRRLCPICNPNAPKNGTKMDKKPLKSIIRSLTSSH
jgi:putative endonuclease